jgi:multidrug resistance efflux pump
VRNKALLACLVVALIVLVGLGAYWPFAHRHTLVLPGIVEIQEVRLGSKIGGRVAKVLVKEGIKVKPGDVLVHFEAPELEAQRASQLARLEAAEADYQRAEYGPRIEEKQAAVASEAAAKARYDRLRDGWRPEEKRMAASELEASEADLEQSEKELKRIGRLIDTGAASRSDYDLALGARDRFRGRVNESRAKVEMYRAGSRKEDIAEAKAEWEKTRANREQLDNGTRIEDKKMARARADEAKAKLDEIDANLREATVKVPDELGPALVEVLSVRPGDLLPPNQPVVRVLRASDLWVKVFVPETQLGLVRLDQKVDVTIDSLPGQRFPGVVYWRSDISEFTPRNVQSADERRYQVFAVKIRVDDPKGIFNAGMAAEVTIPLEKE